MRLSRIKIDAHSQKGIGRKNNQDFLGVHNWRNDQLVADTHETELNLNDLPIVIALADGVGGHENGDIASKIAIESINKCFDANAMDFNIPTGISAAHVDLNSHPQSSRRQMATTIVGLVLCEDNALIFNVGDSRAYFLNECEVKLLSVDDVNATRPRNFITQCIGGGASLPKPHITRNPNSEFFTYVLLSDGVTDWISEDHIFDILTSSESKKSSILCDEAVKAGSQDDVSAFVVTRRPA